MASQRRWRHGCCGRSPKRGWRAAVHTFCATTRPTPPWRVRPRCAAAQQRRIHIMENGGKSRHSLRAVPGPCPASGGHGDLAVSSIRGCQRGAKEARRLSWVVAESFNVTGRHRSGPGGRRFRSGTQPGGCGIAATVLQPAAQRPYFGCVTLFAC